MPSLENQDIDKMVSTTFDPVDESVEVDSLKVDSWPVSRLVGALQGRGKEQIFRPSFQRGVVWDEERQRTLIDSIKQSYPIGSILLYEARFERNKIVYEIVDGLQRSHSLLDYNRNRLQFYSKDDVDVRFLEDILRSFNVLGPADDDVDHERWLNELRKATALWLRGRSSFAPSDGYSAHGLAERLAEVCDRTEPASISSIFVRCEQFLQAVRDELDIDDYKIPVIIFSGSRMKLPEVFQRLNTKGVPLSKYDILGSIWDGKEVAVKREDVIALVRGRQERLDAAAEIDGVKASKIAAGEIDFFDFLCAVGSTLSRQHPMLFKRATRSDDGEPEAHGFTLAALCFRVDSKSSKEFAALPQRLDAFGSCDAFLAALLDVCKLVENALLPILGTTIELEKGDGYHKELQMASIVASVFRAVGPKPYVASPLSLDERLHLIVQRYLVDAFKSYWSGTGDSKALKAIREDDYANPVSAKAARYHIEAWYRETLEAKPPRGNPRTWKFDPKLSLFFKAYAAANGMAPGDGILRVVPALDPAVLSGAGLPTNIPSNVVLVDGRGQTLADVGLSLPPLSATPTRNQIETHLARRFNAMVDEIIAHFAFH